MQLLGKIIAPNNKSEWIGYHINAWLTFSSINGLVISGGGQIDGQGSAWWPQPCLQKNVCIYIYLPTVTTLCHQLHQITN